MTVPFRTLIAPLLVVALQGVAPSTQAETAVEPIGKGGVSMEDLRQKLAERIDEVKSRQEKPPAAKAAVPAAARLAAAHRAEKRADKASSPGGHEGHEGHAGQAHWSYSSDGGPAEWARMKPEFATCGIGQRQSPIDIRDGIRVDLEPITFDYRPAGFNVVDNGHTIQVNLGVGNAIVVNQRRYELVQFHFHRPSEERINGRQYDMVAHLVHKDLDGRLAVVAVLIERGGAHPVVQQVWNSLPLEKQEPMTGPAPLNPALLLPEDRRYFTYMGSLTTPPCSEGVLWMVLKQPVSLSDQQLAVFAKLYPMNARPLQSSAGRVIKESN
jgi:carbonic anhydrase